MSSPLLARLLERLCPHRFSWPHSGSNGQDYQVCLICGTAFAYDWGTMRRTGPLSISSTAQDGAERRTSPNQ
jgi:hypothetical protein